MIREDIDRLRRVADAAFEEALLLRGARGFAARVVVRFHAHMDTAFEFAAQQRMIF